MKNIAFNKKILFLIFMMLAAAVFTVVFLSYYGNKPQIFTDIVAEYPAEMLLNKSPECTLIFFLCAAGMMFYTYFYIKQSKAVGEGKALPSAKKSDNALCTVCVAAMCLAAPFLFYSKLCPPALLFFIPAAVVMLKKREYAADVFFLCVTALYAFYGIYRVYAALGGMLYFKNGYFAAAAGAAAVILILAEGLSKSGGRVLKYSCLVMQIFIPFILLLYFNEKYLYNNEISTLPVPLRVKIAVGAVIAAFFAEAVFKLAGAAKKGIGSIRLVNYGACASIMAFNRYMGFGAIMPQDLHHSYENVIGYFQIFEKGQVPFKEYIPVSGLYSVLEGAFFKFFGGGIFAHYNISQNLFYLFVIMLTLFILRKRADDILLILYSVVFVIPNYSRYIFLLPIMLVLSDERLIKNKNLWLKVWFLTSLFHGLYYPIAGAAVCGAFMPLCLYLIFTFIKSGELKQHIKKISFWIQWGLCILPALLSIKLLWGTYLHVKAMGGQTIFADGLTCFGKSADNFMPYIMDAGTRSMLVCVFTFVVPAAVVWSGLAAAFKFGGVQLAEKRLAANDKTGLLTGLSLMIMPLVAYTSTFVRIDYMFSRSSGILYAAIMLTAVLAHKYIKQSSLRRLLYCFMVFIPCVNCDYGFNSDSNETKLLPFYRVGENYHPVQVECKKLGSGFIRDDVADILNNALKRAEKIDKTRPYYALFNNFGEYFLTDLPSCGMIEKRNVKSYDTCRETVEMLRADHPVVGPLFNDYHHYYMQHWLLTSGEYVYSKENDAFFPNDENIPLEEVRKINASYSDGESSHLLDLIPSAFGMSLFSLMDNCFEQKNIAFNISDYGDGKFVSTEAFYGDDADFVYIKLANESPKTIYTFYDDFLNYKEETGGISGHFYKQYQNIYKKAILAWSDADGQMHSHICSFNNGEFLVPLGLDARWLFEDHSWLFISVTDNGAPAECEIQDLRFLKLREIK